MMIPDGHAMIGNNTYTLSQFIVIGEQCSAVSVATKRLARVETCDGYVTKSACLAEVSGVKDGCAEGLGGIFYNPQTVFVGDFPQVLEGGALPEKVNGDDSLGLRADQRTDAFGGNL